MEMTLQRLGLESYRPLLKGLVMPIGILALVAMMVLPLPVFLLDTFFVSNILVSLLVLMVAINTQRPLDFSSFPSLVLIATVLRLGLNVASTRIVLSEGHTGPDAAGKVIEAFGNFVISGNYAVGLFVFLILIIINLVVITRGAGRVSEVSARFTLDAMPGKQMAIDADLNAGVLTNEEAKIRREEIADEADFYEGSDALKEQSTPERSLLSEEIEETLFKVVEKLPDDLRMAITLREIEGLSYEEIANVMSCPVGTVRSRIFRAREAIDKVIQPLLEN